MKKNVAFSFFLYLLVATSTLIWSCSTEDGPEPVAPTTGATRGSSSTSSGPGPNDCPVVNGTGPMSCKINGTPLVFMEGYFIKSEAAGNTYTVMGMYLNESTGNTQMITLGVADFKGIGSYNLNDMTVAWGGYQDNLMQLYSTSGQMGKICIVEDDEAHIKGYFNFRALSASGGSAAVNITQGYFNIEK